MLIKLVKRLYINHFILEDYGYRKIEGNYIPVDSKIIK